MGRGSCLPLVTLLLYAGLASGEPHRVYPQSQRVSAVGADVSATVLIRNTLDNTTNVTAEFQVLDGTAVVASTTESATIPPEGAAAVATTLHVTAARAWGPDHPHLYELRTVVSKNAEAVEGAYDTEIRSVFGIRKLEVRGTELRLNGEPVRLGGVNWSGAGQPGEEQLRAIREASLLIQLVGSEPAPLQLLEWADRHGLLIIEEAASLSALRTMVERDGNHPSVIAWSFADTDAVKRLDGTRPAMARCGEGACSADIVSVRMDGLEQAHERYPGKALVVTGGLPRGAQVIRRYPFVAAAAMVTPGELSSRDVYEAARSEFSPLVITNIGQVDGVTQISLLNRGDFPAMTMRGYELRVGNQIRTIPDLKPGISVRLDFHSVNPYRVEITSPTGFLVADQ